MSMPEEMLYYLGNKALVKNDRGDFLLLKVQKNNEAYWDLPGGRINRGEDVTTALTREILEETGITQLTIEKHLGMALTPVQIPINKDAEAGLILSIYRCTAVITRPLQSEDNVELIWSPADTVLQRLSQFPNPLLDAIAAEI